ncbi:DUF1631 family protein [Massilia horti]|uniref:DUF1631 family protein n=1 Tax=Massilia horti TaxID=2562153 RepID=A0A4Y9T164_9BURK|nr:DUF1631 family protein [Massilia horti]TFW33002.1 DUF1631 family protein [Massilia horti]
MTPDSAQTLPATLCPSPTEEALAALVAIAARHAGEALMPMITRMVAALLDLSGPGCDPAGAAQRIKSGNLLNSHSYAFVHLASSALTQAWRKQVEQLVPAPSAAKPATPAVLELVPLEEMDSKVAFGAIARPFDIAHSEALALLSVRLGVLLGRAMLRADQNPFRPEVLLLALHQAWREFEPEQAAHPLILPLLRPDIVFDPGPMLDELNQSLAASGRQGKAERFRKTDDGAAARAAKASRKAALADQLRKLFGADDAALDAEEGVPLIPDLPNMPQGNGGWRPSGADGFIPAATAQLAGGAHAQPNGSASPGVAAVGPGHGMPGQVASSPAHANVAPLLDMLGRIQLDPAPSAAVSEGGSAVPHNVFYLPRLKQSLPQGSLSRNDERTLDLLSRIFETVLLDDAIPPATRELIQFLQVPVLKAALRDNSFFFEEAHPARRMLELLSRMGWEQRKDQDDPMFQVMKRSVERVGQSADAAGEAFVQAVADLESSIGDQERALEQAIAEPVSRALRQEKHATAVRAAQDAVAVRVGSGDVVAVISTFLENKWTTVLTLAYTIEDNKPGAVGNATRTMDELIWSVKPKATQEQRRALIGRLPALLTMLNKWLDAIKWQDAERLQFFAQLAKIHASIVRAPIDASPERQLELAVEAAQQDALRRVAQEQAAAVREEAAPKDETELLVDGLERGMWLAFRQADGSERKVKLAWVSPLRTLFIFSAGAGSDAFSMQADKLVDALRTGQARVVEQEGVVGRVLSEAVQQAAVNDAAAVAA